MTHKAAVAWHLLSFVYELLRRAIVHDASKFSRPERHWFALPGEELEAPSLDSEYGTQDYNEAKQALAPALAHHYLHNSHHPEHHPNGVGGMSLYDVVEMWADWNAATSRNEADSIKSSLDYNRARFDLSDQMYNILRRQALAERTNTTL